MEAKNWSVLLTEKEVNELKKDKEKLLLRCIEQDEEIEMKSVL